MLGERQGPRQAVIHQGTRSAGGEDPQEIIEVMPYARWNVALQDPVQGLRKEVEHVWCRARAECENNIVVEFPSPFEAEEQPVVDADWYVTESQFQVKLQHQGAGTRCDEVAYGAINHVVRDGSLGVWYAVVD